MPSKFPFINIKKIKDIKKSNLLILLLVGILLLVIGIPVPGKNTDKGDSQGTPEANASQADGTGIGNSDGSGASSYARYQKNLEKQLKDILSAMDGVGKAEVMITLRDAGELVLNKDLTKTEDKKSEEDAQGSKRSEENFSSQEATVYQKDNDNNSAPFVSKELNPQIEGVLIVAEGGGNPAVVKNISDSVLALFPIEPHKIKVVKMEH